MKLLKNFINSLEPSNSMKELYFPKCILNGLCFNMIEMVRFVEPDNHLNIL